MRRAAYALLLCALSSACSRTDATQPPGKLAKYVLEQAPADVGTKLDASFDGKVTLLGARIEAPPVVTDKDKIKLTLYWRSDEPVDDDVRLSTHLLDGAGKQIHEIDFVGPLRKRDQQSQRLGPGRWKPGHVYVDKQVFKAPSGRLLKTQKLEIAVSLADGEERLPVVRGAHDARSRVKVGELTVAPRAKTNPGAAPSPTPASSAAPASSSTKAKAPEKTRAKPPAARVYPVKVPLKPPPSPSAPKKP